MVVSGIYRDVELINGAEGGCFRLPRDGRAGRACGCGHAVIDLRGEGRRKGDMEPA